MIKQEEVDNVKKSTMKQEILDEFGVNSVDEVTDPFTVAVLEMLKDEVETI